FMGANVTFGSNVIFTHISHLTSRTVFGSIIYDRVGTINLSRNATSFDIRQVKQTITANTVVDFSTSPFDLMISSHVSATSATHTTLDINGTLNMGTLKIAARDQSGYYASLNVNSGARLRTANINGLYSGSATPSCIYPMISGVLRMSFYLDVNSTIEYNGTDSQRLTGTGVGTATTTANRYGFLEINFGGTPDVEYVYIGSGDSTQVRSGLILTAGELNLNSSHNASSSGQKLHMHVNSTITRNTGYLRSETNDGSATLRWVINTTGTYVIPFGKSSTEYIPFTYQPTSGGASGGTEFATNGVAVNNTPFPPTVTHVNELSGADNSNNTVDRFWRINVQGNVVATLIFSSTTSERSGITNPRAQLWEPVTTGWFLPSGIQSNPTISTTQASGQTAFNSWWTLSAASSPLPVELVAFEAAVQGNGQVRLDWVTASEINNDFFTIERSFDGESFTSLFTIDGKGTTSSTSTYKAFDESPLRGASYYRLKQTDFDGTESHSQVRMVNFRKQMQMSLFPNPFSGTTVSINTGAEDEMIINISVFDVAGKLVSSTNRNPGMFDSGITEIDFGKRLENGTYLVEINTTAGVYRERIIKN
ncbi:MAG: T9SS type A sorting domain-containing protein, partial [Bacteroidota bacterium]|nr:T9SS type A sorting domain-containing protein [Bacteroidota bacterium]